MTHNKELFPEEQICRTCKKPFVCQANLKCNWFKKGDACECDKCNPINKTSKGNCRNLTDEEKEKLESYKVKVMYT